MHMKQHLQSSGRISKIMLLLETLPDFTRSDILVRILVRIDYRYSAYRHAYRVLASQPAQTCKKCSS